MNSSPWKTRMNFINDGWMAFLKRIFSTDDAESVICWETFQGNQKKYIIIIAALVKMSKRSIVFLARLHECAHALLKPHFLIWGHSTSYFQIYAVVGAHTEASTVMVYAEQIDADDRRFLEQSRLPDSCSSHCAGYFCVSWNANGGQGFLQGAQGNVIAWMHRFVVS